RSGLTTRESLKSRASILQLHVKRFTSATAAGTTPVAGPPADVPVGCKDAPSRGRRRHFNVGDRTAFQRILVIERSHEDIRNVTAAILAAPMTLMVTRPVKQCHKVDEKTCERARIVFRTTRDAISIDTLRDRLRQSECSSNA